MLILISPAKTFAKIKDVGAPAQNRLLFAEQTAELCAGILKLSSQYLGRALKLKGDAAQKAYQQWRQFADPTTPTAPAIRLYSGMVYKKIGVDSLDAETIEWLEQHLLFCSFAYGLLRPSDPIKPYRLEGSVEPLWPAGVSVFYYWRNVLTDYIIRAAKERGGVLCFLASEEMKQLFHWERVEAAVRVITPRFLVQDASGKTKQIVVYTKMARGTMVRTIAQERICDPEALKALTPEGYVYAPEHSESDTWGYILQG